MRSQLDEAHRVTSHSATNGDGNRRARPQLGKGGRARRRRRPHAERSVDPPRILPGDALAED